MKHRKELKLRLITTAFSLAFVGCGLLITAQGVKGHQAPLQQRETMYGGGCEICQSGGTNCAFDNTVTPGAACAKNDPPGLSCPGGGGMVCTGGSSSADSCSDGTTEIPSGSICSGGMYQCVTDSKGKIGTYQITPTTSAPCGSKTRCSNSQSHSSDPSCSPGNNDPGY